MQGGICSSYPLGWHFGPEAWWIGLPFLATAVTMALIAGDSSVRTCQLVAYLSWHLLREAPFYIWSRQWPWYSRWRIKAHNYCFMMERLVACSSHPSYQIISLRLVRWWVLVLDNMAVTAGIIHMLNFPPVMHWGNVHHKASWCVHRDPDAVD